MCRTADYYTLSPQTYVVYFYAYMAVIIQRCYMTFENDIDIDDDDEQICTKSVKQDVDCSISDVKP